MNVAIENDDERSPARSYVCITLPQRTVSCSLAFYTFLLGFIYAPSEMDNLIINVNS